MNILTVIPARSGSKSLKDKNIKMLNGKPLMYYSINYSLKSNFVTDTLVSTDSKKYSNIAVSLGAQCPFLRPKSISGDLIQDFDVVSNSLKEMENLKGITYDFVILLRPTSPLRPNGLIEKGINLLINDIEATSVRAMTKCSQHPYRNWKLEKDGSVKSFFSTYEPYNLPRQLLPESFFQTGDIEIIRRSTILEGSVSGKKVLPILIDSESYVDIDSLNDFEKALKIFNDK